MMETLTIEKKKERLIQWIQKLDDPATLEALKEIKQSRRPIEEEDRLWFSKEEQNIIDKRLDKAMKRAENGEKNLRYPRNLP